MGCCIKDDEKLMPNKSLDMILLGTQNLANTQSQKVVETLNNNELVDNEFPVQCAAICLWSMPAVGGIFSEKSHAYSFGVLLLKIIGGRKNTSFYYHDQRLLYLLSKAVFDPLPQYDNICSANEATITLLKG
ncbi:unnamed protein product [Prunus armeniaca]